MTSGTAALARAPRPIRSVLFDLDGTLADTAPDLAFALNTLLAESGRAPLPFARIRPEVSHGARALVALGFGAMPGDAEYDGLRARLIEIYAANICRQTTLFPGMRELLDALAQRGYGIGIVTNKPAFLTDRLIAALGVDRYTDCVVSGDTTPNCKPHPEPMLHACMRIHSDPDACLYVGDASRDIEAGRRAGMRTLVALFGYLRDHDDPAQWGADGMVRDPHEILAWIERDGGQND